LSFLVPSPKLSAAIKYVRDYTRKYTREAKDKLHVSGKENSGYMFLNAMVNSGTSEEYITDQILSIIIAGRDTTSGAMTSLFWYLSRNPGSVSKIREEIAALGVADPTWEQLRDMKYLNMVIKEGKSLQIVPRKLTSHTNTLRRNTKADACPALRLFPPVGTNSRVAARNTVLPRGGGPDGKSPLFVPKGTQCRYSSHSLHRHRDVYGEDAEEWRPERWKDLRPE
jgi:cytochrome P450